MEEAGPLVLAYIFEVDEQGRTVSLPKESELALLVSKVERDMKVTTALHPFGSWIKSRLRRTEDRRLKSLVKIYYSMWIVCMRPGRCVLVDGLNLFQQILSYEELPDCEKFIENIAEAKSVGEYLSAIRRQRNFFASFKGSKTVILEGLIDKELNADIQECLTLFQRGRVVDGVSLSPRLCREEVCEIAKILGRLEKEAADDIASLASVKEKLVKQSGYWRHAQIGQLEALKSEFASKINEAEAASKIEILKLQEQYPSKISELTRGEIEEVKALENERGELEMRLHELVQSEQEIVGKLKGLATQRERLDADFASARRLGESLRKELSALILEIENLKMDMLRLKGLAEALGETDEEERAKQLQKLEQKLDSIQRTRQLKERKAEEADKAQTDIQKKLAQTDRQIEDLTGKLKGLEASRLEVQGRLKAIVLQIENIRRKAAQEREALDEEYKSKVRIYQMKTKELKDQMSRMLRVAERTLNELDRRTEDICSQIDNLIQKKQEFINHVEELTAVVPKELQIPEVALLQIPFYLASLEDTQVEPQLYSPAIIAPTQSLLSEEVNTTPLRESFDDILKEKLLEAIKWDTTFEEEIQRGRTVFDLLQTTLTCEVLYKGLESLRTSRIMSGRRVRQIKLFSTEYFQRRPRE
ncbi:MAG: hypothetical protein QXJ75_05120 [Candidatus Bathyarchaeia archaeon]